MNAPDPFASRRPATPRPGPPVERVSGRLTVERYSAGERRSGDGVFPEEAPVAVVVNDTDYAVMLASPADVEDFVHGFLLTEGLISDAAEVDSVTVTDRPEGVVAHARLHGALPGHVRRQRTTPGMSSCGLCGVRSLQEAVRPVRPVADGLVFTPAALFAAMNELPDWQPCNTAAGAMHVAAFAAADGMIRLAREDVGRHNALDKLIGALLRDGVAPATGFVVTSSRCSYEMVQKSAAFSVPLLCTASAPTALAIRLARRANMSLVSLARGGSFLIGCGGQRIAATEVTGDG